MRRHAILFILLAIATTPCIAKERASFWIAPSLYTSTNGEIDIGGHLDFSYIKNSWAYSVFTSGASNTTRYSEVFCSTNCNNKPIADYYTYHGGMIGKFLGDSPFLIQAGLGYLESEFFAKTTDEYNLRRSGYTISVDGSHKNIVAIKDEVATNLRLVYHKGRRVVGFQVYAGGIWSESTEFFHIGVALPIGNLRHLR